MLIIVAEIKGVAVLTPDIANLDAGNVREFKDEALPRLTDAKKVVFDLSRIQFVDSSGLGAILSALRKVNSNGGELKICGMTRTVHALFELVRMHRVFDIHKERDDAIKAFGG